ncbi:MAG: hypothetical protein P1V81_07825 [Planctomycetota bacterium]|nr:hypothetical protein [Planctomycetota bacterium]
MKLLLPALVLALAPTTAAAQDERPPEPPPARAWQQDAPYRAPDFEAYFPDDAEGGKRLDELFRTRTMRELADDEYVALVRAGLRRTTQHRTLILSEVGNRLIWGQDPQHPEAIELCYHAADFTEVAAAFGTRHYAVYFGLSCVTDKTPAILRTLVDLCVAIDDPNDLGRVAWGAASQLEQLLTYLAPHLASEDPWVAEKAAAVERIFKGELGAFEWAAERAKLPPRPKVGRELPEVRRVLDAGDPVERVLMLRRIANEGLLDDMDASYVANFAACAGDVDPTVREQVAMLVGQKWIRGAGLHRLNDEAVDLLLRLSQDASADVRYQAVYYGLSGYRGERADVLARVVDMLLSPAEARSHDRLRWSLGKGSERLTKLLDAELRGSNELRAQAAFELHKQVYGERPAFRPAGLAGPSDLVGTWRVTVVSGGREGLQLPDFVVRQDTDGVLVLDGEQVGDDSKNPLGALLYNEVGTVLHFSFHTTLETVIVRTTGRLEGDHIEGTTRIDGGDSLTVWTAERVLD